MDDKLKDLIRTQLPYPTSDPVSHPVISLLLDLESRLNTLHSSLSSNPMSEDFVVKLDTSLSGDGRLMVMYVSHTPGGEATVDWGDGTIETFDDLVDDWWTNEITHTYDSDGEFTMRVYGDISTIQFGFEAGAEMITECESFGVFPNWRQDGNIGSNYPALFGGCVNLVTVPNNIPSNMNSLEGMFSGCSSFNGPELTSWDTSNVISMEDMFSFTDIFNQDISSWDVSSVTNMETMFNGAQAFNQDLSGWCVENILEAPANFDLDASSWALPRPVWGTCPQQ